MLGQQAQKQVSSVGGGFAARSDVKADEANATALAGILQGVEVFQPDRADIDTDLDTYVQAWQEATGS